MKAIFTIGMMLIIVLTLLGSVMAYTYTLSNMGNSAEQKLLKLWNGKNIKTQTGTLQFTNIQGYLISKDGFHYVIFATGNDSRTYIMIMDVVYTTERIGVLK